MINTLDDLVALTERHAAAEPLIADSVRLRKPGISSEEIVQIREAFPLIPEAYLEVAARISLLDVQILAFSPAPGGSSDSTLLDRLRKWNAPGLAPFDFLRERKLICVGEFHGDPICVRQEHGEFEELAADRGSLEDYRTGEVIHVELVWNAPPTARRLTWTFEQTLLGFGRLRERRIERLYGADSIEAFIGSLSADFELDQDQLKQWEQIAWVKIGEDFDAEELQKTPLEPLPPTLTSTPIPNQRKSFLNRFRRRDSSG